MTTVSLDQYPDISLSTDGKRVYLRGVLYIKSDDPKIVWSAIGRLLKRVA